jgi:hypothetical protein
MATDRTFDFNSTRDGRPWRVKLLLPGDAFGRENCLTVDRPFVEFWDRTHAGKPHSNPTDGNWPSDGQFVTRYCLETMLEHSAEHGIDLVGYAPAWKISAADFGKLAAWLLPLVVKLVGKAS